LGASYFRTAGAFDQYGASARGLSLNAGGPGPEEFPRFTAFWLEPLSASSLTVYALLDGPSVSGAYRIASRKTEAGVAQSVRAVLFFRRAAVNLGLAPLTSMFWYGAGAVPPGRSAYPQVHDSDGLALWTGAGERLWRPLDNPPRVLTNTFLDRSPRAFGLLQRDRAADHYQDRQALYERRPNLWVRPLEGFAQGSVRLVEIPTDRDTTDNIVAFWSPSAQPKAGRSLSYAYDLDWMGRDPSDGALAQVAATRTRPADASGGPRRVQVDFQGPVLKSLGPADRVEAVVTQPSGTKLAQPTAVRVGSEPDLWRVEFDLPSNSAGAINLRAFLRLGERTLSETWIDQIF
jgi:glucans biosynthesis protein